ncbi:hypothetical protein HK100_010233 [Physocladia obscura]|uniref:Uncharacterized protein n=1 Tax=Physocladia obscura TaxID=109957 RepID=A0AAD5T4B2_9FUNG|nr:hypothetical protein HK100_010233 [Physocladia obscura]
MEVLEIDDDDDDDDKEGEIINKEEDNSMPFFETSNRSKISEKTDDINNIAAPLPINPLFPPVSMISAVIGDNDEILQAINSVTSTPTSSLTTYIGLTYNQLQVASSSTVSTPIEMITQIVKWH